MHKSGATFGSSGEQYDGGSLGIERNRPDIIRISLDRDSSRRLSIEPCLKDSPMKTVEYWRWRYRNPDTGQICRTMSGCSVEEATKLYSGAERIEGTMVLRSGSSLPISHIKATHSSAIANA